MTTPTETCFVALSWTGVETSFSAGFRAASVGHVKVYSRDSAGVDTLLTLGVHYGVTLAGDGSVTVTPAALPAAPRTILILRDTPAVQETDFANLSGYLPGVHTALHDAAARRDGEDKLHRGRAILAPLGETMAALPALATRANKLAGYDSGGNLAVFAGTITEVPVSAYMVTVNAAIDAAAARTLLGLADAVTQAEFDAALGTVNAELKVLQNRLEIARRSAVFANAY